MSQTEISQPKKKKWLLIIILILLAFVVLAKQIFFKPTANNNETALKDQQVWEKSIKHGKLTFSSSIGSNSEVEFWFDAPKYRLTWYNSDASPRIHMISQDGKTLYFAHPEEETSEIAYVTPEMHLWIFNGPDEYLSKETETEDGYEVTYYDLDKLWSVEGASQDFYLKDLKIYRKNNQVEKIVTRTSSNRLDSDEDLAVSTYQINQLEYLDQVDPGIFELPYPVVEEQY